MSIDTLNSSGSSPPSSSWNAHTPNEVILSSPDSDDEVGKTSIPTSDRLSPSSSNLPLSPSPPLESDDGEETELSRLRKDLTREKTLRFEQKVAFEERELSIKQEVTPSFISRFLFSRTFSFWQVQTILEEISGRDEQIYLKDKVHQPLFSSTFVIYLSVSLLFADNQKELQSILAEKNALTLELQKTRDQVITFLLVVLFLRSFLFLLSLHPFPPLFAFPLNQTDKKMKKSLMAVETEKKERRSSTVGMTDQFSRIQKVRLLLLRSLLVSPHVYHRVLSPSLFFMS